ncbi:MAG: hypothetical protein LC723_07470 [Actinobacteria bacterium]|nr:hypothetical protein [Actinomycetota bacterium]
MIKQGWDTKADVKAWVDRQIERTFSVMVNDRYTATEKSVAEKQFQSLHAFADRMGL